MSNVIVKNRSQVFGYYDHNMLVMSERISDHLPETEKYSPKQRLWYIRAKEVIISSGSIERPLVFGNNDTPGVMLSSAAKEYLKIYGVLVGKKPLVFTNNDSGYETAIEFVGTKSYHPPISTDWTQKPIIFCPDLLDYYNKIIIEYEEEIGKRLPGAKLALKGHHREGDMDTRRDIRRNLYYKDGKFRVLRIYESDLMWHNKLAEFLLTLDECRINT